MISITWIVSPDAENPLVYSGTQIANTSSDRVSDIIVAPNVTTIGSRRLTPSLVTMDDPSSVWEASSDPTTIAGNTAYPSQWAASVPNSNGIVVVTSPNTIERNILCRNSVRLISNPAKNISSSMPSSEKNSATGCSRGKTSSMCGPRITPLSSSPTTLRQADSTRQPRDNHNHRHQDREPRAVLAEIREPFVRIQRPTSSFPHVKGLVLDPPHNLPPST